MELLRRVGGDLTYIEPSVQTSHICQAQPPVVGVAVGGGDAGVPCVGDVPHSQQVWRGQGRVSQPGDLRGRPGGFYNKEFSEVADFRINNQWILSGKLKIG